MAPFVAILTFVLLIATSLPPETTVILLPDEEGKVGAVTVTAQGGSRVLDQAYGAVTTETSGELSPPRVLEERQVLAEFADLLKAQPPRPAGFMLYFDFGSADLADGSKNLIPQIVEQVAARRPTAVLIVGHTDAVGSDTANMALSRQRAMAVLEHLKSRMPDLGDVTMLYFGAQEPLVQSPPDVPEPRNRRVEVVVY